LLASLGIAKTRTMGKTVTRKPRRSAAAPAGKGPAGHGRNSTRRQSDARRTRSTRAPERAAAHTPPADARDERDPRTAEAADLSDLAREVERESPPTPAPARAKEAARVKTDSEDHLSTYFRDLAVHDLLGPEQEREIAQGIEDQEILTWERVLARADVVPLVVTMLEGRTEQPLALRKLVKAAEAVAEAPRPRRGGKPDPAAVRAQRRLEQTAREVAEQLRPQDVDRTLVDQVLRELRRIAAVAARGGAEQVPGAAPLPIEVGAHFDDYLSGIWDAYQGSSQLREEFVRANLRLVVTMARRYDRGGMPLSDLIQEGNLGLMHAVSRFDYRRGLRFSTYACWWIRHAIGRALADKARAVRIPVHMLEAQQQLEKVRQHLIGELGRQPTPQELARAARVPLTKLNQMHRYLMGQPMSLDRPVHEDDDRAFGEMLADPTSEDASPADSMTTEALTKQVSRLLRDLSPIEADVLRQRFGLVDDEERTFREIGDQYRLSRERIRQIQNSALDKLKKALVREHPGLLDP
jgi:RNA polymerase primary sigma factor